MCLHLNFMMLVMKIIKMMCYFFIVKLSDRQGGIKDRYVTTYGLNVQKQEVTWSVLCVWWGRGHWLIVAILNPV